MSSRHQMHNECYEASVNIGFYGNNIDYTNQFNAEWKKNQFRGRKVERQATMLPPCPIGSAQPMNLIRY